MRPLTFGLLSKYWRLFAQESLIDAFSTEYSSWDVNGIQFCGTRFKMTNAKFGLVRIIYPNGNIHENCYRNGRRCGLGRKIEASKFDQPPLVTVTLYDNDKQRGFFEFDGEFRMHRHASG